MTEPAPVRVPERRKARLLGVQGMLATIGRAPRSALADSSEGAADEEGDDSLMARLARVRAATQPVGK